jgi:hypothetical protein
MVERRPVSKHAWPRAESCRPQAGGAQLDDALLPVVLIVCVHCDSVRGMLSGRLSPVVLSVFCYGTVVRGVLVACTSTVRCGEPCSCSSLSIAHLALVARQTVCICIL